MQGKANPGRTREAEVCECSTFGVGSWLHHLRSCLSVRRWDWIAPRRQADQCEGERSGRSETWQSFFFHDASALKILESISSLRRPVFEECLLHSRYILVSTKPSPQPLVQKFCLSNTLQLEHRLLVSPDCILYSFLKFSLMRLLSGCRRC